MRNVPNPVDNSGSGCLALRVCLVNSGSEPMVVGSLCRSGWGLALPRCGKSFSLVTLCLAEIEPLYCPSDSSNAGDRVREVKPYSAQR